MGMIRFRFWVAGQQSGRTYGAADDAPMNGILAVLLER
jgi:hypothetical protein